MDGGNVYWTVHVPTYHVAPDRRLSVFSEALDVVAPEVH